LDNINYGCKEIIKNLDDKYNETNNIRETELKQLENNINDIIIGSEYENIDNIINHMNNNIEQLGGSFDTNISNSSKIKLLNDALENVARYKINYMTGGQVQISKIKGEINQLNANINAFINAIKSNNNNNNNLKEFNKFIKEKNNKYNQWQRNEKKLSENRQTFSIGEISYYNDILHNIIQNWEKMGLKDITIIPKNLSPQNLSIRFFNKINDINLKLSDDKYDTQIKITKYKYIASDDKHNKIKQYLKILFDNYYIPIKKYYALFNKILNRIDDLKVGALMNKEQLNPDDIISSIIVEFNKLINDILNEFILLTRRPVSVYLRINDMYPKDKFKSYDKFLKACKDYVNRPEICKNDKYYQKGDYEQWLENDKINNKLKINMKKCNLFTALKEDERNKYSNSLTGTTFSNIFYKPMFSQNETIATFMLLDKLLYKGVGTLLITYGYSGVGKTFTLFGDQKNKGLLQATINNIQKTGEIKSMKLRTYELYGMGLIYSDLWNDYNKIDQRIIDYNLILRPDENNIPTIIVDKENYINDINNYVNDIKTGELFLNLPADTESLNASLSKFNDFVNSVELKRKTRTNLPKRIRPTVNNPESSRSKLIYDFIIEFENGVKSTFVIDDTPGAENPISTYIENNDKLTYCPTIIKDKIKIHICDKTWQKAMLYAILINPLYLAILAPSAVALASSILKKYYNDNKIGNEDNIKFLEILEEKFKIKYNKETIHTQDKYLNNLMGNTFFENDIEINNIYISKNNNEAKNKAKDIIIEIIQYCYNIEDKTDKSKYELLIDFLTIILSHMNIYSKDKRNKNKIDKLKTKYLKLFNEFIKSKQEYREKRGSDSAKKVSIVFKDGDKVAGKYYQDIKWDTYDSITTYMNMDLFRDEYANLWKDIRTIIYYHQESEKLKYGTNKFNEIKDFITLSMEANFINQNILGIMKETAIKSGIPLNSTPQITGINDLFSKPTDNIKLDKQSLIITDLINKGNYSNQDIINQIKKSYDMNVIYNTTKNGMDTTVVKEIIEPYIEGDAPIIQDYKMFYVLQNNKTQLKCLEQFKLYHRMHNFLTSLEL